MKKTIFEKMLKQTMTLNAEMEKAIVEYVKENNNFVDTSNMSMYGYVFNYSTNDYAERKILTLKVDENNKLLLLLQDDEENFWEGVSYGEMIENATLNSICEQLV